MNVFLRLFQGLHYDKYLQCHISTENTIFIATANSIEDIPETILNLKLNMRQHCLIC